MTVPLGFELFVRDRNATRGFKSIGTAAVASEKQVAGLSKTTEDHSKRSAKAWGGVSKAAGLAAAGGALALGAMVKASMDFDKAMSGVGAVADASADDLNKLRDAALKAGADTAFSASQAAEAEGELAKAGVSTADILGGALRGSLDLAAAGQLDLADASTISAQAMNIFKLGGKDVGHIADVLAAGANKSAADVGELGFALRAGGGAAASMGLGLEDTIGTLAAFADNALVGQDAGTSLKTAMIKLAAPSQEAATTMHDLGINAFDTSGKFVGLENFAGQLQTRMGKLTDEQRNSALATIFGTDAIRAGNIWYKLGASGVKDYTDAVNDQGAAGEMAAKQMDNLAGDLEALKGSIETALIKGGSNATGALRGMTQGATDLVNAFSGAPDVVQKVAIGLLAVGTGGFAAIAAIGTLVPKINAGRDALRDMGRAGEIANTAIGKLGKAVGIGGAVFVGLEALYVGIGQVQDAVVGAAPDVDKLTQSLLKAKDWTDIGHALGIEMDQLGVEVRRLTDKSVEQSFNDFTEKFVTFGQLAPKSLEEAKQHIGAVDAALTQLVQSGHGDEAARQFGLLTQAAEAGGASVDDLKQALPGYTGALANVDNQNKLTADSTKKHGAAVVDTTGALKDERTAAERLKAALDLLNGINLSLAETDIAWQASLDNVTQSVKDNGRTVDVHTEKGRANRSSILDAIKANEEHSSALADEAAKTHTAAQAAGIGKTAYDKANDTLWKVARQSGITRTEFDKLTGSVKKVPKTAETKITTPGMPTAKADAKTLKDRFDALPTALQTQIRVNIFGHDVTLSAKSQGLSASRAASQFAGGGTVPGSYRGPTSDHVPIWATPREEVISVRGADKARRQAPGLLEAINAGQVDYKRLDIGGDEGTLRLAYGRLQKLAVGGTVAQVQARIRGTDALPYVWGAAGPYGYDCSGLTGAAYGALTGRGGFSGERYFTTASNFQSLGFRPGLGAYTIGVTAGRGHMLGNLAGLKFEARSTAAGILTGGAAGDVRSMARQYYLASMGGQFGQGGLTPEQIHKSIGLVRPLLIKGLFKRLGIRQRDTGGPLLPGQAAVNVRGGRERVLNAAQTAEWERGRGSTAHDIREALDGMEIRFRDPLGRVVAGQLVVAAQRGPR